jgi:ribokinase
VQLEVPLPAVKAAMELARDAGACVILDPAPAVRGAEGLLDLADYVTPNESELVILVGAAGIAHSQDEAMAQARGALSLGAKNVVAKLGSRGALLVSQDREVVWPAVPVAPVDTTAAGDVWNGAFATALAEGRSVDDAGAFANAAAALSVTRRGAQPAMPTRGELEAWCRAQEQGRNE